MKGKELIRPAPITSATLQSCLPCLPPLLALPVTLPSSTVYQCHSSSVPSFQPHLLLFLPPHHLYSPLALFSFLLALPVALYPSPIAMVPFINPFYLCHFLALFSFLLTSPVTLPSSPLPVPPSSPVFPSSCPHLISCIPLLYQCRPSALFCFLLALPVTCGQVRVN